MEKHSAGFTMIEIIIATLILLLLLFTIGILIPVLQMRMRKISHHYTAVTLGENVIERIRSLPRADIPADATYVAPSPPLHQGMSNQYPPSPYPGVSLSFDYTEAETGAGMKHMMQYFFVVRSESDERYPAVSDLKKITVDVYWPYPPGTNDPAQQVTRISSVIYSWR